MESKTFQQILELSEQGREGVVFLGCGGDLQQWVDGINNLFLIDDIIPFSEEDQIKLEEIYKLETTGGRIDLCFMVDKVQINISKLAIWKIRFGGCTWLSDYVVNYRNQHGVIG